MIKAILWTGAPWRDPPERYGPWKTAHERLRLWTKGETWARILDEVMVKVDSVGDVARVISVASRVVPVHQHAT
ncbi:Putative transposase of IS4/5 family [Lentzea waywayandensis]|uniref:Putative transposase of IS4/5 family n=1 Tax=Lentzea waywayandensis TaxID=84724 RepID=A0A1I6FJQ0_9PSEU|nr:Putative transposase of IS4/5 family [Lentzea waywayandensis]